MEERELSQVSVSTYLTALRRLCEYLVARGDLDDNPARSVKGNRRPDQHSRGVLAEADVETLLDAVPSATLIGLRDRALVSLMVHGGLAEIEIVRSNRGDLDQTLMGTFLRVQGKGRQSKDEQVPLDPPALDPLLAYLRHRDDSSPEAPLFVSHGHRSEGTRLNTRSIRGRINGYLRAAGLKRPGISPHSLTHTAALIWLNDGMDLEEVRRRMRHGTLETTMISFRKQGLLSGRLPRTKRSPNPTLTSMLVRRFFPLVALVAFSSPAATCSTSSSRRSPCPFHSRRFASPASPIRRAEQETSGTMTALAPTSLSRSRTRRPATSREVRPSPTWTLRSLWRSRSRAPSAPSSSARLSVVLFEADAATCWRPSASGPASRSR